MLQNNSSIAIVGGGITGATTALMLGRLGVRVTLYEQVAQPQAVGAGILLQPTGLAVLRAIDPNIEAELNGAHVTQLLGHTPHGRMVMDCQYRHWRDGTYGLGIHRGALFEALWQRLRGLNNVTIHTGTAITRLEQSQKNVLLFDANGVVASHDALIIAEGVNSKLRAQLRIKHSAKPYPWGAFYAILPSANTAQNVLSQRYEAARKMTGVLPMGQYGNQAMSSFFWSVPIEQLNEKPDVDELKQQVLRLWPQLDVFLEPLKMPSQLTAARYADVNMPHWHDGRVLLVGDAAHGMSPQLGQGANMGMLDAYVLAKTISEQSPQSSWATIFTQYSAQRKNHLRYYQWASRSLTPMFQSNRTITPFIRDALMGWSNNIPMVRRFAAETLVGIKTGWFRTNMDLDHITSLSKLNLP